jgi:cytosine/adenosine deaminase-related metal-dependent hydrolase
MSSNRNLFVPVTLLISTAIFIASCVHKSTSDENRSPATISPRPPITKPTILIGNIPGIYIGRDISKFYLGYVEISPTKIISAVVPLGSASAVGQVVEQNKGSKTVIVLTKGGADATAKEYDAIYPGLLNLHNHTKQNVLPAWPQAQGQFQNRFEWRDWGIYKKSVSQNMNPWITYGGAMNCAAFRWSNLQNMINGAIFLQGPSSCISGFGIYKAEDAAAYVSEKAGVQAPTDLIYPNEMTYVWQVLKKDIDKGMTYEQALFKNIKKHCSGGDIDKITSAEMVNQPAGVKILSNKATLEKQCTKETDKIHPKFIRYVYFIHKTIAGKKEYIKSANHSAIIAHMAEGRRLDPYNQTEYQMIKLLGLNKPNVNFIHGVGLRGTGLNKKDPNDDFIDMANNKMGLIWSPYSNLLLYGQTLDIEAAHAAGVNLAIGSDWVPTGTKSTLEEIKLAAAYVDQTKTRDGKKKLNTIFTDEYLYKMMTENGAKAINHWGSSAGEAGVGQIAVGSMGSLIAVGVQHSNPFTNIVRYATEREINLVVVDGAPIYGNINYLQQAGIGPSQYEIFSNEVAIDTTQESDQKALDSIPKPDLAKLKEQPAEEVEESAASSSESPFLKQLATHIASHAGDFKRKDNCKFAIKKAFVTPNTKAFEKTVDSFSKQGLDLDKVSDIQLLLAASSMSQSLNKLSPKGDPAFAMTYFPNLYTCNDSAEKNAHRYKKYVTSSGKDELAQNIVAETRSARRNIKGFPKTGEKLATEYGLIWEVK